MILSLENETSTLLDSVLNGSGAALGADTGYTSAALYDGRPEVAWRSSAAATTFRVHFTYTGDVRPTLVALFGVRCVTAGVTVKHCFVERGSGFTNLKRLALNSRGDGAALLNADFDTDWSVSFSLSGSSKLQIDEVWWGQYRRLRKGAAAITRTTSHGTITNETPGGTVWTAQAAAKRTSFELAFPPLTDFQDWDHDAIEDDLSGSRYPAVLIPHEDDLTQVYHGRFGDGSGRTMEPDRNFHGRVLTFTESGRTL